MIFFASFDRIRANDFVKAGSIMFVRGVGGGTFFSSGEVSLRFDSGAPPP